jgi:hypothetical protein
VNDSDRHGIVCGVGWHPRRTRGVGSATAILRLFTEPFVHEPYDLRFWRDASCAPLRRVVTSRHGDGDLSFLPRPCG